MFISKLKNTSSLNSYNQAFRAEGIQESQSLYVRLKRCIDCFLFSTLPVKTKSREINKRHSKSWIRRHNQDFLNLALLKEELRRPVAHTSHKMAAATFEVL